METLAETLLQEMPSIIAQGKEYGGELFEKFILYGTIMESFGIVISMITVLLCFYGIKRLMKIVAESRVDVHEFFGVGGIIVLCMFLILFFFFFLFSINGLAKVIFMPELYLIDYFNHK